MSLSKKLIIIILVSSIFLGLTTTTLATETKISAKKGVGLACAFYCWNKTDPAACNQKIVQKTKELGATWYYDWAIDIIHRSKFGNTLEFVPMVHGVGSTTGNMGRDFTPDRSYSQIDLAKFRDFATQYPGSYWLIWNEPDLWPREGQKIYDVNGDGTLDYVDAAIIAARIYKPLRRTIKNADPAAKMIIGGVSGQNYYHYTLWPYEFIKEYRRVNNGEFPPLEGWHFHLYKCGDDYLQYMWQKQIRDIRDWIDTNGGGQNKELWMTEFGCLFA